MPAVLDRAPEMGAGAALAPPRTAPRAQNTGGGDWPRTTRVMPWSLALFVFVLWLVPFDSTTLPVNLPFDLKLDRILLGGITALWLLSMLSGRSVRPVVRRLGGVDAAILAFLGIAVASILVNATMLAIQDEFVGALKKVVLLGAYVLFFYLSSTILRPSELWRFCVYMLALASVAAVGTVWEYRTGTNLFYLVTDKLPGFSVSAPPADPRWGRELISGPTQHAIAIANMMAFALPIALLGYIHSAGRRRLFYAVATLLIFCGAMATIRKTGAIAPVIAVVLVCLYRPKGMWKALPLGLAVILFAQFVAAPGSVVRIKAQLVNLDGQNDVSTQGRTEDYPAVKPDISDKPALGRGHGSWDVERYRLLDNEYLQRLIETGYAGFIAYIVLILSAALLAHRLARSRRGNLSEVAIVGVSAAIVYGVVGAFYDELSFPEAPYLFFLFAAMVVVAGRTPVGSDGRATLSPATSEPEPARTPELPPFPEPLPMPRRDGPPPRVTVLVPAYNATRDLARLFACLRRQTLDPELFEVIVVDDSSSDGTFQFVQRSRLATAIWAPERRGSYNARNVGLRHARGEVVAFTDADCLPEEDWLERGLAAFDADPDLGLLAGHVTIDLPKRPSGAAMVDAARSLDQEKYVNRDGFGVTANLWVRRDVLDEVGGFSDVIISGGDTEFCHRATATGAELRYGADVVVHHPPRSRARDLWRKSWRTGYGAAQHRKHGTAEMRERPLYFLELGQYTPTGGLQGIERVERSRDGRRFGPVTRARMGMAYWLCRKIPFAMGNARGALDEATRRGRQGPRRVY